MSMKIGDLIFLLNPKPPRIIPGKITEQIITRNLSGEQIRHIVRFTKDKTYTLENIEKPWFSSLEDAGAYLESEAKKLISKVLEEGRLRTETGFFADSNTPALQSPSEPQNVLPEKSEEPENLDSITVDLGDGKMAKVSLPEVLK